VLDQVGAGVTGHFLGAQKHDMSTFLRYCRQSMTFRTYLLRTMAGGGVLGGYHGILVGYNELLRDVPDRSAHTFDHRIKYIYSHAPLDVLTGTLLGPWGPLLAIPWYTTWRHRCYASSHKTV
jgi:hypothetical protein